MYPWLQPDTPSLDFPGLTTGEAGGRADRGAQRRGSPLVTAGLRQVLAQAERMGSLEVAPSPAPPQACPQQPGPPRPALIRGSERLWSRLKLPGCCLVASYLVSTDGFSKVRKLPKQKAELFSNRFKNYENIHKR